MSKKANHRNRATLDRRTFAKAFGLTVGSVFATGLAGCRDTDTLTRTIYTEWADEIDPNSPYTAYENVPNADPTPSLPSLYKTKSEVEETEVELPEYENEKESDETTEQTEYNKDATSSQDNSTGTKSGEGDGNGEKGDDDEDGESDTGNPYEEADSISSGTKQGAVGGDAVGNEASRDITDEPEKEGSIIAFGEIANLVAMLGGKGTLWGCDDTFATAAKTLYGNDFVEPIRGGFWPAYAAGAEGITNKQFKKLCRVLSDLPEEERPVYLIYDGSIGCPVSESQAAALENGYGIVTTYFFLGQQAYLKNAMNWLRKAIGSGAKDTYDAYWAFHDGLLDHLSSLNGGVAAYNGGSTECLNFRDGSTYRNSDLMEDEDMRWTLIIDQWDRNVTYKNFGLEAQRGLGICTLGWKWSEASYYMQCGGVINNAAAIWQSGSYRNSKTYHSYAWAMGTYYAPPTGRYISGASVEADSFTTNATDQSVGVLMCSVEGTYGLGKLGTAKSFPSVVVMNKNQKEWLEYDRDHKGVYAGHYVDKGATSNNPNAAACGIKMELTSGTSLWTDYIGWTSAATGEYGEGADQGTIASSKYRTVTEAYDVLVNPHGFYSNWITGSAESVLEAAWAFERLGQHYADSSSAKTIDYQGCSSAEELVGFFYKTFYGNEPDSDILTKIMNGGYAV